VERVSAFGLVLDKREQQVIDHGGSDLSHGGVFRGAEERLEFEILLDPFEEGFDLPP